LVAPVAMPELGLEVTEGIVAAIHVAVGSRVTQGDPLLELETDKALTDVVAPRDGILRSVEVRIGDTVAVGETLAVLAGDLSEEVEASMAPVAAGPGTPHAGAAAEHSREDAEGDRLRAAPVARRAAERLGVALTDLVGTGPRGRITLNDVELHVAAGAAGGVAVAALPAAGEQLEPLSPARRAVARRMTQSQLIPQFALHRELDATWLLAERERITQGGTVRVSVNDLLVQALAETVARHPDLGLAFVEPSDDGRSPHYRRRDGVDVGIAVATAGGLLVPVIRRVDTRSLHDLASERVRLAEAARSGRLALEEMSGATITLSSLAAFGVDSFAAMLNPGESAILAVGRAVEKVRVRGRGLEIVATLALALTIDHRVVDGATGGAALAELAELLEGGMGWRT